MRPTGVPGGAALLVELRHPPPQATGVVSWDLWASLWRFWPVIIIAIGLSIKLGRRAPWARDEPGRAP